jgi:peptidoglycan/LPS O-acetylase OafA/YrhL
LANGPVLALVLSAVLVLAAEFPLAGVGWDLAIVFIVLPMILLGGVAAGTRAHAPLLEFLGDLSYPLYVVHFPIVQVVTRAREKLMPALPPGGGGIIAIVASLAAATILFYGFDLPVRRWLARRQIGGQP